MHFPKSSHCSSAPGKFRWTPQHERLHHLLVRLPPQPRMAVAHVAGILQQALVVRPHVQAHGQAHVRMQAACRHVQAHLPHRDPHAVRPQVPQTQNPLSVRHHDQVHLRQGHPLQDPVDAPDVLRRDVDPPEPALDPAHLQARRSHRRRIDDRHHLPQVVHHQAVEHHLAPVLKPHQEDVLLQVVPLPPEGLVRARYLRFQRFHRRAHQPFQLQRFPFVRREARSLVHVRIVQHLPAAAVDLVVRLPRQRVDLEGKRLHGSLLHRGVWNGCGASPQGAGRSAGSREPVSWRSWNPAEERRPRSGSRTASRGPGRLRSARWHPGPASCRTGPRAPGASRLPWEGRRCFCRWS